MPRSDRATSTSFRGTAALYGRTGSRRPPDSRPLPPARQPVPSAAEIPITPVIGANGAASHLRRQPMLPEAPDRLPALAAGVDGGTGW